MLSKAIFLLQPLLKEIDAVTGENYALYYPIQPLEKNVEVVRSSVAAAPEKF